MDKIVFAQKKHSNSVQLLDFELLGPQSQFCKYPKKNRAKFLDVEVKQKKKFLVNFEYARKKVKPKRSIEKLSF